MDENADSVSSFPSVNKALKEEVYERVFIISHRDMTRRDEFALSSNRFSFETSKSSQTKTKWLLGFETYQQGALFRVYLKLCDVKGFPCENVEVTTNLKFLKANSTTSYCIQTRKQTLQVDHMLKTPLVSSSFWNACINANGEIAVNLKLIIMEPETPFADLQMREFHKTSVAQVCSNFASLLGDETTADLKIVTSDGKELLAHKAILKAQCPVFEAMFRSEFSESKTGIIMVKDVSAKTMRICLHLLYCGELLPFWKDEDTVVEFTYAVGKYQLTNVLALLNKVLGNRNEEDASFVDVQLLDLAQKFDLKKAEKELMERIKKSIAKMNTGAEFFALGCGLGKEK